MSSSDPIPAATMAESQLGWRPRVRLATRPSYDALVSEMKSRRLSVDEAELLRDSHWHRGEDARLREDVRFRPTPWGRWILSASFLGNDAVLDRLRSEHGATMNLEAALASIDQTIGARATLCTADPRLVFAGHTVRLSAQELSDRPRLESEIGELERYTTHLPVHSLRAAAASAPAGDWRGRKQEEVIETLGWLSVSVSGLALSPRMFVARVEGRSMDDGKSGLVDGAYAVFELWPAGTRQNLNVLVRGAFTDPETGAYAVKKYVADMRGPDGQHQVIRLVSLNPDRTRFPDIELDPREDTEVTVVAKLVHALRPGDFARSLRAVTRRGRRDITSDEGQADIAKDLADHADVFFSGLPPPAESGLVPVESWRAELVCMEAGAGGLHVEAGPLQGLWSFVKKLRATGVSGEGPFVLASNVRERPVRAALLPGDGPWRFSAVGFEDDADVDFSALDLAALGADHPHVFRLDAEGVGRRQLGRALSVGQRYRLLVPPDQALQESIALPAGGGWQIVEVDLTMSLTAEMAEAIRTCGLTVGEASPSMDWVLSPPAQWRTAARGEVYACFDPRPGAVALVTGVPVEHEGEASAFLQGATGTVTLRLAVGERHVLHLGDLDPGRYMLAVLHRRTAVPPLRRPFEVVAEIAAGPAAHAELRMGSEVHVTRPGKAVMAASQNLASEDGLQALEALHASAPPGWPLRVQWHELVAETRWRRSADDGGQFAIEGLEQALKERVSRRPVGNVVFDFAELGQVVVPHDRQPDPATVMQRLAELVSSRGAVVERLAGSFAQLMPLWFEPVCAALGYDIDSLPEGSVPDAPSHAMAMRLMYVERQESSIHRNAVRLLILVEDLEPMLTAEMKSWIDETCAAAGLRDVLLSDGLHWAMRRRARQSPLHVWHLGEAVTSVEQFSAFLSAAAEGM